jgi:hypothetical protein
MHASEIGKQLMVGLTKLGNHHIKALQFELCVGFVSWAILIVQDLYDEKYG